jgi:hypothetical protein
MMVYEMVVELAGVTLRCTVCDTIRFVRYQPPPRWADT